MNTNSVDSPSIVGHGIDSSDTLELTAKHAIKKPNGNLPNTLLAVSLISFLLGGTFLFGLLIFFFGGPFWWTTYQLGFFVSAWAAFHYCEFATTAGWNREKCNVDSFLLNNGKMYHIAHLFATIEYLIALRVIPDSKKWPYISEFGIFVTIGGQLIRSAAMIHASTNFSHTVAYRKAENHQLVTRGIYTWFRHPSYAGFYYWALGTQVVLQNPLSFIFYSIILWRFFFYRIRSEEKFLIKFFGDEYVRYRSRVGVRIPFIV